MTSYTMNLIETNNTATLNWIKQHKNTQSFQPKELIKKATQFSESVANKTQHKKLTPHDKGMHLMLLSPADKKRVQVEQFIAAGYARHFAARLVEFFPIILAVNEIETGRILGAVGLRYADDYLLFSEKYLNQSIESLIAEHEAKPIQREHIIEMGHFVVDQAHDLNAVIPLVAGFLKSLAVKWAVYTLSRPIKLAFQKFGIQLTHLQHAHKEALIHSKTDWGKYYDFKPAVYYSDIENNMN